MDVFKERMFIVILEQLSEEENFTNVEKQLANYLLENLAEISNLSARKLGENSYTSKASVIRFCQKLGFSGYEEFKNKLDLEYKEWSRIKLLLEKEPVNKQTKLEEIFNIVPNIYTNTLNTINLTIDKISFKRVIGNVRSASTVDIYGAGVTYTCATTAKFKFRTLGINCNTYSGINEHYIRSTSKNGKRVAIILSFTGANKAMIEIAQYLKASGFYVVGIGGNESNGLKEACHDYLEIISQQLVLSMEVMSPFIAITYIFDLLFTTLLVADFEKNVEAAVDVINFRKNLVSQD